ncbi:hypothetical protein F4818DRAFT_80234 [Hypoxylon cercidicola]|nr:hypothetical protein F4818DRAFT_80234 [Hypoxylon cercidicola]
MVDLYRFHRLPVLPSLPNEILSIILGNFCLHCRETEETPHAYFHTQQQSGQPSWYSLDSKALYSMCLVSRKLRDVAQPILYHQFIPGYGDCWGSARSVWDRRLLPFVRTIILRPDLAAMVRRLYFHFSLLTSTTNDEVEAVLEQVTQTHDFLSDFLGHFHDKWPSDLTPYQPFCDELGGLLLVYLPNLTSLSLTGGTPSRNIPSSALRAAGVSSLRIQTIDLLGCGKDWGYRLDGILEMASSTLKTLNLNSCTSAGLQSLARPLPNLRNLRLTNCKFGSPRIESRFPNYMGLETFVYDAVCEDELPPEAFFHMVWRETHGPSLPSDVFEFLDRNKATLKTLRLDLRFEQNAPFMDERNITKQIPSLRGFPVLQNLYINSVLIYSTVDERPDDCGILVQLLPPPLVSLHVAETMGGRLIPRLVNGLLNLAETVLQGQFSGLKEVRCDIEQRLDDYAVGEMFARAGVDFGYETWPFGGSD